MYVRQIPSFEALFVIHRKSTAVIARLNVVIEVIPKSKFKALQQLIKIRNTLCKCSSLDYWKVRPAFHIFGLRNGTKSN